MLQLRYRLRNLACIALLLFLGAFLTVHFISEASANQDQTWAFASDGTPIAASETFFVTIHDRGESRIIKTRAEKVARILEKSGVTLSETDIVEPSLDAIVESDFNINIYRSRPALIIDGATKHYLMTASYSPEQIAREAGLTVYDGDTFTSEFNTNFLETGPVDTYRIERNGGRTFTIEESLPYTTETRYDASLAKGEKRLEQAGEDGRRISIYEVKFENNVEVSRELISETVTLEPVPEIVTVGVKVSLPPEYEQCAGWAREAGVAEEDLAAAVDLMYRESGCRVDATNAYSGAYGIPQALPGSKMAEAGADWATNPVTQIRWMTGYVNSRYGGWQGALDFWWCTGTCSNSYGPVSKRGYWY